MEKISYFHGGEDILDDIKILWEGLNKYHESVSTHFEGEFRTYSFEQRKEKLKNKYQNGKLRVDVAKTSSKLVGYIISGITEARVGEIESIYIDSDYRSRGIGENLMNRSIAWLDMENAQSKVIDVAVGNENVYGWYARFGFFPRVTRMKQKAVEK